MSDDRPSSIGRPPQSTDDTQPVWKDLRLLTAARIGLPTVGGSLAIAPLLEFKLAHARARDAVREELDVTRLINSFKELDVETVDVASAAGNRQRYLLRPDLGRRLAPHAEKSLGSSAGSHDVVFVVADGLSARAVQTHARPVLVHLLPKLRAEGWRIAPVVVVRHGRVAIGDQIAGLLTARCVAVLIGERPGLTAPDSMGAYLTWQPGPNTTDADRNCISNIRSDGVGYQDAAQKIAHLLRAMRAGRISGVSLKDDSDRPADRASIDVAPNAGSKS
jgi:ethanolamine ammonia-lyase small subunit